MGDEIIYSCKDVRDILSTEGWSMLSKGGCYLVDVRTEREWREVGVPNLSSIRSSLIKLSWILEPTMLRNESFFIDLEKLVPDRLVNLLFICKSGVRSKEAASWAVDQDYMNCYNISDGFEGSNYYKNSGWKLNNLPWGRT